MRTLFIFTLLSLAAISPATFAAQEELPYNRVTLNESASQDVDNDQLVAVLFAQAEGSDAAQPADEVNRIMDWALKLAKEHSEVKSQTLGYNTQPVYNKSAIRGWRVNQSLRLESRDARVLGDLIGKLQQQLQVQSLNYQVSEEQRRKHLDALTDNALRRFQQRAATVAKSLGRSSYRIVRLDINDGRQNPMPMMRGAVMHAEADFAPAPAAIDAGTQSMQVSVSGEIEVSDN
ncbi:SIMPL domain-containing protein [Thiosocius teredinicola]|uniref:SIMPL domain-containing protein n=1 Tax=Thiosocius teredinicola TaxID=1973002 RepID=UPI0009910973